MKFSSVIKSLIAVSLLGLLMACGNGEDHDHHAGHDSHEHGEESHAHDHGEALYYCPMHPEVTDDEPGSCPICGMDLVQSDDDGGHEHHDHDHHHEGADGLWTCPMHPQIERDEPGSCPICGMNLVQRDSHDLDDDQVHVPQAVQQAMNVRTTKAERSRLLRKIETVGRVSYDESRLKHIHPRVEGWIEELDVDSEGAFVESGQRLFTLYSPELVNAQEEFLQALRRGEGDMIRAARGRLEALGVQHTVISIIENKREVLQYVPWYAHGSAYVTTLNVRHGMYVEPGDEIMALADLTRVWVLANVFESQAGWVEVGQNVTVGVPHAPGEPLHATVSHIYPVLDERTRTLQLRVPVTNSNRRLRPGMWASLSIHAQPSEYAVIIPQEAVIRTGRSARVVIREDDTHFRVREVTAGMASGNRVVILDGIDEGDEVVLSGQFLIDSEASIRAGHGRVEDHSQH